MSIHEILLTKKLPASTTPRLDLELLLIASLGKSRSFLYANPTYILTQEEEVSFEFLYQRRWQGEPVAYILGKKEFWSQEFMVNEKVLIPRPETEILIEVVLHKLNHKKADIADLGTGSGAIALVLAKECLDWHVVATDISTEALQVASYNAIQLEIKNVEFYCGDWCSALPDRKFDAIVSNPPYIAKQDPHLKIGDVRFEPKIAFEAGDGLEAIKKIIIQAKTKLKTGGLLVLEHGYNQSEAVQALLQQNGYRDITPYRDLAGIYRVVAAELY